MTDDSGVALLAADHWAGLQMALPQATARRRRLLRPMFSKVRRLAAENVSGSALPVVIVPQRVSIEKRHRLLSHQRRGVRNARLLASRLRTAASLQHRDRLFVGAFISRRPLGNGCRFNVVGLPGLTAAAQ